MPESHSAIVQPQLQDATEVPVSALWARYLPGIEAAMAACGARPQRTVIWLPYAQAMAEARRAWAQRHPVGFAPRFESSRNWAAGLAPFEPAPTDLSHDTARDSLLAAAMVERLGVAADPALRGLLATRLLEAARQLAPLAAAVAPEERAAWSQAMTERLPAWSSSHDFLRLEQALAQLALAWVGHGGFATDVLWGPLAAPGEAADCLVLLAGAQPDPLAQALCRRWGERAVWLDLPEPSTAPLPSLTALAEAPRLHACLDSEDEAQRAAACVLVHLNQGRQPVALVATDRLLTRRVSAWLASSGVRLRDETGWKLSTTHSAAQLMAWLRAARAKASMDDVLDALKQLPPGAPLLARNGPDALEQRVRRLGPARWRDAAQHPGLQAFLPASLAPLLLSLQPARPLLQWLDDWRAALQALGLWGALNADAAGRQLLSALRLEPGAAEALAPVAAAAWAASVVSAPGAAAVSCAGGRPMALAGFTAWVREVLEGATFVAAQVAAPQVVVLPLGQLLGRGFAATVAPGCDELHLSPNPEPPGNWTEAQREGLGLATRAQLGQAAQHLWQALLAQPQLDLLWRTQTGGELCLPSPWVQALLGASAGLAPDPRPQQALLARPVVPPQARAPGLLPERLSASAYQRLRDCPYRFFALSMLGLSEAPELDLPPSQRDFGNWLHEVLRRFHEARSGAAGAAPGSGPLQESAADRTQLQALAEQVAQAQGLAVDFERAGFLPFWALWPALRDGYLDWLWAFEVQPNAPRFESAELALGQPLGACTLVGTLDRVDVQHSPSGPVRLVLDYKTEARATTKARVQNPMEDTQLAFYAALMGGDNLRAAYLSITDKRDEREGASALFEQTDIGLALDALLHGLQADWRRLAQGHPMAALGEGRICTHCEARGLCRKGHW